MNPFPKHKILMTSTYSRLFGALLILILITNCNSEPKQEKPTNEISRINIDSLEVFADFETHDIAQPTEIEILDNGTIAIANFGQRKVSLVQSTGELITSFGREGRGPGEFIRISNLFNTGDIIHVVDTDQSVVSKFDLKGNFLSSFTFKSPAVLPEVALIDENKYVAATGGTDDSFLSLSEIDTDSTFSFGTPKGESLEVVDFQASLNQLKSGEIPNLFKNMVTLRSDGDHIYAYLNAYSELRKYDTSGSLIWEQKIDLPYNEEIFNNTVEQAKNSPGGLPAYNYITDFEVIDQEVMILTSRRNSDDSQLLVRLNESGNTTAIYTLPDHIGYLRAFDLAPDHNAIYFASSGDGVVYKSEISF